MAQETLRWGVGDDAPDVEVIGDLADADVEADGVDEGVVGEEVEAVDPGEGEAGADGKLLLLRRGRRRRRLGAVAVEPFAAKAVLVEAAALRGRDMEGVFLPGAAVTG